MIRDQQDTDGTGLPLNEGKRVLVPEEAEDAKFSSCAIRVGKRGLGTMKRRRMRSSLLAQSKDREANVSFLALTRNPRESSWSYPNILRSGYHIEYGRTKDWIPGRSQE